MRIERLYVKRRFRRNGAPVVTMEAMWTTYAKAIRYPDSKAIGGRIL